MTGARSEDGPAGTVVRRGPIVAEIAALALCLVADSVAVAGSSGTGGLAAGLATATATAFGPTAAVLAVLRRRFTDWIGPLGGGVVAISLLDTAIAALAHPSATAPGATETLALALLVGAGCRRTGRTAAVGLAVCGGVAMTAAPVLRYGVGSPTALIAVPAALLWGGSLAVGLILRDADTRRRAALAEARTAERLRMARELHDFVAHHVTGIVVRAQAARVLAGRSAEPDDDVFREIEEAGSNALTAMRRLVGMLREDTGQEPAPPASGIRAAVLDAAAGHDGVVTDLPGDLDRLDPAPAVITTVHRVVLEALTNVRRHAPDATDVRVSARVQHDPAADVLHLEVLNDGAGEPSGGGSGYGLVGMAERVSALGGTLRAGAESGRRWRITVRLPLHRQEPHERTQ
ncbi:sensor histidine kinase [Actinoallomurus iriomotensis]|uniref:histidine kinase n=1 Tax=Actinoallomurus iriomotensis TaxID=478107 RepID=A0A9W6S9Z9_9ACTN|nr:histidine kinase [Actinoallomurus iriomotensis]GLY91035.1 two-component sensor histidine kinase [Actinoallomurus iriomotensis]